jgi:hypothetical protein
MCWSIAFVVDVELAWLWSGKNRVSLRSTALVVSTLKTSLLSSF